MEEFCSLLDKKHMILAPFCGAIPCEDEIKKISARCVIQFFHKEAKFEAHK